jgi:hypothetical protein
MDALLSYNRKIREKAVDMTTRSRLLTNILRTWDQSAEGYLYLRWLIDPEVADCLGRIGQPELEGGDVLREAVLDILEGPGLERRSLDEVIEEFCNELATEDAAWTREEAAQISSWVIELQSAIRERAKLYQAMGLKMIAWMNRHNSSLPEDDFAPDFQKTLDRRNNVVASEKLSATLAARSRTTAEVTPDALDVALDVQWRNFLRQLLLDVQWRKEHSKTQSIRHSFEEWKTAEELDRYYASQLVTRLEQIVERAATLDRVQLEITDAHIKRLFQAAHETFLYGFDVASVALCRSLVEHALQDKLPPLAGENRQLGSLIERADREKALESPELERARKVLRAGNDVMHRVDRLRQTAQDVLDCTRSVLDTLYGTYCAEATQI